MVAEWGKITAGEVCSPIGGNWISGDLKTVLKGVCTDSRRIRTGELFWALSGERYDGHNFIANAIEKGAAGCVVNRGLARSKRGIDTIPESLLRVLNSGSTHPVIISVGDTLKALGDLAGWWRHQHNVRVVAITGSTGKTTTKEMLACILELGNRTLKNKGNLNNLIGLPLTLLQLDEGCRNIVVEMGMNRPGEIARLTEIADPDVGVITNVGMAHLEGLGDMEKVAKAKTELVEKISSTGKMVINGDDRLLMKEASVFKKEMITFGLEENNHIRAQKTRDLGREGVLFDLCYQNLFWPVGLKVPGLHNVSNALAAAAAGLCLCESPEHIMEGLSSFKGVKGRFEVSHLPQGIIIVDDTYNANPSSLEAVINSVGTMVEEGGRIIVALGEMMELGDVTVPAHRQAGQMVADLGVYYFFAMGEHASEMIKGAVDSGMSLDQVEVVTTHSEMVNRIKSEMRKGDLVFLKGSRKMSLEKVVEGLQSGSEIVRRR